MHYIPKAVLKIPDQPHLGSYVQFVSKLTGTPLVGSCLPLPDESEFLVQVQGRSIKLKTTNARALAGGGKRGYVMFFSDSSRLRLMHLLSTVLHTPDEFFTLTYPSSFPLGRVVKSHLDIFAKRFKRMFPNSTFVWKLEYQKRGAPHYHCILWWSDLDRPNFVKWKLWLSSTWFEIVDSGDSLHMKAGTNTQKPNGPWNRYLSKYISKNDIPLSLIHGGAAGDQFVMYDPASLSGRFWGVINRAAFRVLQDAKLQYSIAPKNWRNIRAWLNRITGRKTNKLSCSFMVDAEYTAMQISLYAQDSPSLDRSAAVYLHPSYFKSDSPLDRAKFSLYDVLRSVRKRHPKFYLDVEGDTWNNGV